MSGNHNPERGLSSKQREALYLGVDYVFASRLCEITKNSRYKNIEENCGQKYRAALDGLDVKKCVRARIEYCIKDKISEIPFNNFIINKLFHEATQAAWKEKDDVARRNILNLDDFPSLLLQTLKNVKKIDSN
jgi:hypothetical protein